MAKTKKKSVEVPLLTPQPMEVEKKKVKRAMEDARTPASYKKAKTMEKVVSAIEDNKPFKKTKLKGKKKVIPKRVHAKTGKISRNVSKHDDDSGDLEEELPLPKAKKSVISKVAMAASSSEEDESDGGESCEEEPVSKPVITNGSKANSKASSHGVFETPESGSDEESDGESEEEKPVAKICASSKVAKKTESSDDDEDDESEEEDDDEGDESEEEPSKLLQGKEQITAVSESSDNSDETDEEESDEEEPVGKKQKTVIHTPHKTREDIAGSTTVFVKNLAWAVTEDTIHEFFGKDITDVRLATDDTGRFKGFGHVEFKNEAAAKKAVQKSGHKFLGREIFCELARERGTQGAEKGDWKSPQSGGYKSNATPGGFRSGNDTTAFVKGFDKFQDEDTIRKELIEFFGECGKVNNVRVPTDRETQQIKGFAYLEFVSSDALSKALELNGQELNGRCLVVDEASQPSGDSSGRGRGGRGRGFGGRGRGFGDRGRGGFGGRARGGFRGGDRGRGGRGGRGDGSRHKHSGRKTTFGDE